jgi:flagellar hook-associated protein 2
LSAEERSTRYDAVGLFQRVSDILDDHVSTLRDSNGKKGLLLEKAGITGDASVGLNDIQKELTGFDDRITTLLDRLADKEEAYYRRFTAMEQALQRMNDQSNWLASQLGGM